MIMKKDKTLSQKHPFGSRIAVFLIITFFLASCSLPSSSPIPNNKHLDTSSELTTQPVEIKFNLRLPGPIPTTERIVLEVLDEVTGLPYHPQRFDLIKVTEQEYTLSFTVPDGSVIKYRYARMGADITPEAIFDGNPVRYRIAYAAGQTTVTDNLFSWYGESSTQNIGNLTGKVIDQDTNLPLADILVSVGGQLTMTDALGTFNFEGLTEGIHNVLFYAIDGSYQTFQQGASIASGQETAATVSLISMPMVNITFNITAPYDALGAPIYIAGNLVQLGNTFSELSGGMSIKPRRMPSLASITDNTYTINLQLYANADLRFKFTLGDGYWNAENDASGEMKTRQLIVPRNDISLNLTIEAWRMQDIGPITFEIFTPPQSDPSGFKYIQFKTLSWTEPLPLWPLGNGKYLFILYSPLRDVSTLFYRFCRDESCQAPIGLEGETNAYQIQPSSTPQTIPVTIEQWSLPDQTGEITPATIPTKSDTFTTIVEWTPAMNPSWLIDISSKLPEIVDLGANMVVYSPQWFVTTSTPLIKPKIGTTPFYYELSSMLFATKELGLQVGIFPQIEPTSEEELLLFSGPHSDNWWEAWFTDYRHFILNYAKLAEISGVDTLFIGGKLVLPSFSGGVYPNGSESDTLNDADSRWLSLIDDIRAQYSGKLIWATQAHLSVDPLPAFIDSFDGVYISVESPIASGSAPSPDEVAGNFTSVIDNLIYEIYRSTQKPIMLAFAYPSVKGGAQGCLLLAENCYNNGLFFPEEVKSLPSDGDEQAAIYNAIFPIIASRSWITGISIRGYEPFPDFLSGSSSIAHKPASDVVRFWFRGLTISQ